MVVNAMMNIDRMKYLAVARCVERLRQFASQYQGHRLKRDIPVIGLPPEKFN
jgi:hypothetical protein